MMKSTCNVTATDATGLYQKLMNFVFNKYISNEKDLIYYLFYICVSVSECLYVHQVHAGP